MCVCVCVCVSVCVAHHRTHDRRCMCICVLWFTKADKLIDAWTLAKHKLHRWLHNNWGVYYNVCSHLKPSKAPPASMWDRWDKGSRVEGRGRSLQCDKLRFPNKDQYLNLTFFNTNRNNIRWQLQDVRKDTKWNDVKVASLILIDYPRCCRLWGDFDFAQALAFYGTFFRLLNLAHVVFVVVPAFFPGHVSMISYFCSEAKLLRYFVVRDFIFFFFFYHIFFFICRSVGVKSLMCEKGRNFESIETNFRIWSVFQVEIKLALNWNLPRDLTVSQIALWFILVSYLALFITLYSNNLLFETKKFFVSNS